jgi:hypothetical protein
MAGDNHDYKRVATHVHAWLRVMGSAEEPAIFHAAAAPSDEESVKALQGANLSEALVDFLLELNNKLNTVISLLSQEGLENDFPVRAVVTEAGGSGVRLQADDPSLHEGAHVEIVMVLGQIPLRMAGAVGKLTRREDGQEGPEWTLDFTRIRERDLDTVIQFVFQEERQRIRERKWD